jgi:hypothetical protein
MRLNAILVSALLALIALAPVTTSSAAPPPNPLPCTNVDTSNPHFYGGVSSAGVTTGQGQAGGGLAVVYSTNGVPAGCDQVGSDGDNEQGLSGAQMPIVGAYCPYSQGTNAVGHHGDDIFVTNMAGIDVTWSSGVDGQDPAATLAGQTCTGNGIISDTAASDPADCSDSTGANVNLLGSAHDDTHPLGVGTNDAASGFTCFDSVDGNEWTFLNVGPYVGTTECTDTFGQGQAPNGQVGFSLPIQGTVASGVESVGDSDASTKRTEGIVCTAVVQTVVHDGTSIVMHLIATGPCSGWFTDVNCTLNGNHCSWWVRGFGCVIQ